MKSFYYLHRGKSRGPISEKELVELIQSKKLGLFDILCEEGENRWKPLSEYEEFLRYLQKKPTAVRSDKSWIVLLRRSKKGFLQQGPFTEDELRMRIRAGEIRYTDYAWSQGMVSWKRLGSLSAFQSKSERIEFEQSFPSADLPELSALHSLEEIEKQAASRIPDQAPSGHEEPLDSELGPNEAQVFGQEDRRLQGDRRSVQRKRVQGPKEKSKLKDNAKPVSKGVRAKSKASVFSKLSGKKIALVTLFCLGLGVLISQFDQKILLKLSPEELAKVPAEMDSAVEESPEVIAPAEKIPPEEPRLKPKPEEDKKAVVEPPPEPQPEPKKILAPELREAPRRLRVLTKNLSGDKPALEIETDGSSHFPLTAEIFAEPGRVLGQVRVEKYKKLKRKRGENFRLELDSLGLKAGEYRASFSSGEVQAEIRFFLGSKDKKYAQELRAHKKFLTFQFEQEKRTLFNEVKLLESLTAELQAELFSQGAKGRVWNRAKSRLENLATNEFRRIQSRGRREQSFLVEEWTRLRDLKAKCVELTQRMRGKTAKSISEPEKSEFLRLRAESQSFKAQVSKLSFWD